MLFAFRCLYFWQTGIVNGGVFWQVHLQKGFKQKLNKLKTLNKHSRGQYENTQLLFLKIFKTFRKMGA